MADEKLYTEQELRELTPTQVAKDWDRVVESIRQIQEEKKAHGNKNETERQE